MYPDIVNALQPTVVFLRVCGVWPSALRRFYIPKSNYAYSVIVVIVASCCHIHNIFDLYSEFKGIFGFMSIVSVIATMLNHVVLTLSAFLGSELLIKFFRIMESVQRSLGSLNIRQNPYPSKTSQIVWIVIIITPNLLVIFCEIIKGTYLAAFRVLVQTSVVSGTVCKVRVILALIDEKFELLNWHLDDLNNRWPLFLPRPPDVSFRELSCVREFRRTKFILESEDTRIVTADKINRFNKAHLKLVYVCRTFNSVFSFALLFHILSGVLTLTVLLPYSQTVKHSMIGYMSLNIFSLSLILGLTVILSASSKVQDKAQKTALLVHDILDEGTHSADVVQELEEFSMSLLHRKVLFTAAGFFDVNLKLVSRIAGILAPIILFLGQNLSRMKFQVQDGN